MTVPIFTPDEIASMNAYQESGAFHPFICGFCGNDLIAREDGWYCPTSGCLYRQEWAQNASVLKGYGRAKDVAVNGRWILPIRNLP